MVTSRMLLLLCGALLVVTLVDPVWTQDDDAVSDVVGDDDDIDDLVDDADDDNDDDEDDDEMTMPPPVTTMAPDNTTAGGAGEGVMEDLVTALGEWEEQHMEPNSEAAELVYKLLDEVEKTDPDVAAQMRTEIDQDLADMKAETQEDGHRKKRMVVNNDRRKWTGAKVPFKFTSSINGGMQREIKRAFAAYEQMTCFRFYEYTGNNGALGLNHGSYLNFIVGGGCWSEFGRTRHGQSISCCGGKVCLHELGHAFGAYHDQADPKSRPFVRMNIGNVQPGKEHNFGYAHKTEFSTGYVSEGVMHYDTWAFQKPGKGDTITVMDKDIRIAQNTFYLFQELSLSHKCGETYCKEGPTCVNDGYKTYHGGNCACVCPYGLDPATGCATTINDDSEYLKMTQWPRSQYALPRPQSGCPAGMAEGSKIMPGGGPAPCNDHNARGCPYWGMKGCRNNPGFMYPTCPKTCQRCKFLGSYSSDKFDLVSAIPADASTVETGFCVNDGSVGYDGTTDDGRPYSWPAGSYCIYRAGGSCPAGFNGGSVTFKHGAGASDSGTLADMDATGDSSTYWYCCRSDGLIAYPISLPLDKPFSLIALKDSKCPKVAGANLYQEFQKIRASVKGTGQHPQLYSNIKGQYRIAYCYYQPTKKSCGGVIDLTADNKEVTIEGNGDPEQECHWMVKTPNENDHIRLNVDSMNIATWGGKCLDVLEVRYNRIGTQPREICGTRIGRSMISIFDMMMITYRTKDQDRGSNFKATITLIQEDDLCYNAADNGQSYAGTVNVTRYNEHCVPWASTQHCRHNLFQHGDHLDNLESNYCRNPDSEDGRAPWCYTDARTCKRSYCDVCQFEERFDVSADCGLIKELGVCKHNPETALRLCARTCAENTPVWPPPAKASTLSCGAPEAPIDGEAVDPPKDSYRVGEQVAFACTGAPDMVYSKRCLTDGSWSSLGFVCTECPDGWWSADGQCFMFYDEGGSKSAGQQKCEAQGATLAMITTEAQNKLVAHIGKGSWLGGSDGASEGNWKWDDGTAFSFTNWRKGEPDNWWGQQHCVSINNHGEWLDEHCDRDWHTYTCMKPARKLSDATVCTDFNTYCMSNYIADPRMCAKADAPICKMTCGICQPGKCDVEAAPKNAELVSGGSSIDVGGYAEYKCKDGADLVGGNTLRGCKTDGTMTGNPIVCNKEELVTTYVKSLVWHKNWGGKYKEKYTVTGKLPEFIIPKTGKITQWRFYSMRGGNGALQIWKCKGKKKCALKGSNELSTPSTPGFYTYYVPKDKQIKVKKGYLIGIYMGDHFGVPWIPCDGSSDRKLYGGKLIRTKKPTKFKKGKMQKFKKEKQECRHYELQAVIE